MYSYICLVRFNASEFLERGDGSNGNAGSLSDCIRARSNVLANSSSLIPSASRPEPIPSPAPSSISFKGVRPPRRAAA